AFFRHWGNAVRPNIRYEYEKQRTVIPGLGRSAHPRRVSHGAPRHPGAVWFSVDRGLHPRIRGEIVDRPAADSSRLDYIDRFCRRARNDSGRSPSPDRSAGGDPTVHRMEHNPVAPEHAPARAKHIPGTLHYRRDYHRIVLARFAG